MGWKLNKTIFGVEFDVDVENKWLLHDEFYERKLKKLWTNREFADRKASKAFIADALYWLPGGHFIIFFFDGTEEYFVQFFNSGGNITLNLPMWHGSASAGKEKELVKLLRFMKFTRKYRKNKDSSHSPFTFYDVSLGRKKKEMQAEFGENHSAAADATLLIAGKIYDLDVTGVFYYYTDKLQIKKE